MRNFLKTFTHHPDFVKFVSSVDALVVRLAFQYRKHASEGSRHILLTTTGDGNIGDQAMFEAFLENVKGNVGAVMPAPGAFRIPQKDRNRVVTVPLESLIYGRGANHYRDLWRLGRLFATAKSFSISGADIMDGGYNARLSEMEWTTAIAARLCGIPTQILGFSWNSTPSPSALALARRAGKCGVRMHVRDPLSLHRMEAAGVSGLVQAADTVFLLGDSDPDFALMRSVKTWMSDGHRVALMNCSGLIDTSQDLVADYVRVVEYLIDHGYRVVLIPHVIRPDSNDLDVCRRVQNVVGAEGTYLVEALLDPRQVKELASMAELIVTGRMHLSVLGLSVETPSVVLATQGKVEGLMASFNRPEWNIVPREGFSIDVMRALDPIMSSSGNGKDGLASCLESVSQLSSKNFDMLQEPLKVSS